jgi:hypothetical protein
MFCNISDNIFLQFYCLKGVFTVYSYLWRILQVPVIWFRSEEIRSNSVLVRNSQLLYTLFLGIVGYFLDSWSGQKERAADGDISDAGFVYKQWTGHYWSRFTTADQNSYITASQDKQRIQDWCSEPEFVNLLRSPGIDSQPGGPVQQPYLTYRPARLFSIV